jgi:hypothetical protein
MNDNSSNNVDITPIDMATLTLLTNVNCRAKLESLEGLHNLKNKHKTQLKQDIKFYRKRIISGVKDILLKKKNESITDKTRNAFETFVTSLIDDFKVVDITDIVQDSLDGVDSDKSNENENKNRLSENENNEIINEANDLLKNTKVIPVTMDKYVIKKQLDKKYARVPPLKQMFDSPTPENIINLREPSLRTKGIKKSSKENMDKNYEDNKYEKNENKNKTNENKGRKNKS